MLSKKAVQVNIGSGVMERWTLKFEYEGFEDFKQSLLKRFGNLRGTRKAEQHRDKVKALIHQATTMEEIEAISQELGWTFEIIVRK